MENLKEKIKSANWFAAIGTYPGGVGKRSIKNLHAWDETIFKVGLDQEHAAIAEEMDWLPSTKDEIDPFYGDSLRHALDLKNSNYKEDLKEVYSIALKSLRHIEESKLISGPHNYVEVAKGAALYCSRMAAVEVVVGRPGVWCDLLDIYCQGYWPCGRLKNGTLIVY
ncbi:hypothetical protein GNX71_09410 [Variovorax sp. RKNM96]|uniref:hypothetical protein n=1 Tax=Variovorax sp. RKNM96 TaxID=2681552 RepID=UPI001981B4A7|nr:hypothetical protein [Variovorax sp. RKNM96]QSI29787.1 hypothetical protein GNX71_09410 [Variovorax sp. RKNM96]